MLNPHRTLEEARATRYNQWAGNPSGWIWNSRRCAYEVQESGRGGLYHQCEHRPLHGPANLYCKQHAKRVKKEKGKE